MWWLDFFLYHFHLRSHESFSWMSIMFLTWVHSMLLLLSRFSRVRLCAAPEMAAHQAPPSLGFSRQEHWSGLPIPSPMHESEKWKGSLSVVSDSSHPMDCSLPGSSIHGIFQARVLEWGAIAFSGTQHIQIQKKDISVRLSVNKVGLLFLLFSH